MDPVFRTMLGNRVPKAGDSRPFRYGTAILVVALVFVVRLELQPVLESRAPFLLFTFSVMVSAWYGGFGPGLLATILGTAVGFYFFLIPTSGWMAADRVDSVLILLSVFTGVAISILSGSMYSARARAENAALALRHSEERYRRIVETANEGILLTDPEGRATFSNQTMASMLGSSIEQILGRPIEEFVVQEDRAAVAALVERRRQGVGDRLDFRLRRSDGSELWTLMSASPVFGDQGEFLGSLAMVSDVTERRRANEALRESEHQLKLSLQSANAATLEWNLVTRKMSWSDEHFRLFGIEPGGFEPTTGAWIDRLHPEDRERVRSALVRAEEDRSDVNIEYRIVLPDLGVRWVHTRGQVFFNERGRAERMLGVVMDITERKKFESEREEMRLREQAARDREQATRVEAARKSQEFKSAVLDAVAHDMKTPLTAIKAAVTCLLSNASGGMKENSELLCVINEETDRMNSLVTDAIEAARVEVGRLQLEKGPHHLKEAISAALDEIKHKARGREVQVQLGKPLAPADIDLQLVKHVFKQLLDNAIKYSPEGTPLKIACRPSGDRIIIDVADSGPGIPKEEQIRIFEEFYRAPTQRKRASGTGMGLFIAKRIVDAHGGKIWVTSRPGFGSIFHVALPVYRRTVS